MGEVRRLWAPWRNQYINLLKQKKKGCIFCRMGSEKKDHANYIFRRTKFCYAVLNIYPYNNGHVLIVPKRHANDLVKLTKEEKADLYQLLEDTKVLLDTVLSPDGYNIGLNLGRVAGAGFPGHVHIHLVPRWNGDVNFMPVVGEAKVISQSLRALYQKLKEASSGNKKSSKKPKRLKQ